MHLGSQKLQGLGALAGIGGFLLALYLAVIKGQSRPSSEVVVDRLQETRVRSRKESDLYLSEDKQANGVAPTRQEPTQAPTHAEPRGAARSDSHSAVKNPISPMLQTPRAQAEAERGGLTVSVNGFDGFSDDVEIAVMAALEVAEWAGFRAGGRKQLHVSGSLRDLPPTLNQIATARASATWEVSSASGEVLAQGGVADRRGTGPDQSGARARAVELIAVTIADQISRQVPQ